MEARSHGTRTAKSTDGLGRRATIGKWNKKPGTFAVFSQHPVTSKEGTPKDAFKRAEEPFSH